MSMVWKTYPQQTVSVDVSKDVVKLIEEAGIEVGPSRASDGRLGVSFLVPLSPDMVTMVKDLVADTKITVTKLWAFVTS